MIYLRRKHNKLEIQEIINQKECKECGSIKNLTIDHIIPISENGLDDLGNYQILCEKCNKEKAAKLLYNSEEVIRLDVFVQHCKDYRDGLFTFSKRYIEEVVLSFYSLQEIQMHSLIRKRDVGDIKEYLNLCNLHVLKLGGLRYKKVPRGSDFILRKDIDFQMKEEMLREYVESIAWEGKRR